MDKLDPSEITEAPPVDPARVYAISRPDQALLWLYVIRTIVTGPLAPLVMLPLLIKYFTLQYHFDAETVTIRWGFFFRQETFLTYARIQDIHLTRTLLERWLGIGTVEIQTASSTAGAVESLLGLRDHEAVRDFLYQRMRGTDAPKDAPAPAAIADGDTPETTLATLVAIRDELRSTRAALEARP